MNHVTLLRSGSQGDLVRQLQQALLNAGIDPHGVDGIFGSGTDAAVRQLQRNHGLDADGIAGPQTWAALGVQPPSANPSVPTNGGGTGQGLSAQGGEFIATYEGCQLQLYNNPAGYATIGIGHLVHRSPIGGPESAEFKAGLSRERALELLHTDSTVASGAVLRHVKVPLNQHELDALISFAFNVGEGNFASSTVVKKLNVEDRAAVPNALAMWTKAGNPPVDLPGLVTRRQAEGALFSAAQY